MDSNIIYIIPYYIDYIVWAVITVVGVAWFLGDIIVRLIKDVIKRVKKNEHK